MANPLALLRDRIEREKARKEAREKVTKEAKAARTANVIHPEHGQDHGMETSSTTISMVSSCPTVALPTLTANVKYQNKNAQTNDVT